MIFFAIFRQTYVFFLHAEHFLLDIFLSYAVSFLSKIAHIYVFSSAFSFLKTFQRCEVADERTAISFLSAEAGFLRVISRRETLQADITQASYFRLLHIYVIYQAQMPYATAGHLDS